MVKNRFIVFTSHTHTHIYIYRYTDRYKDNKITVGWKKSSAQCLNQQRSIKTQNKHNIVFSLCQFFFFFFAVL